MTMQMDLHPQYITNEDGEKVSVILPIEEYEELIEQYQNDKEEFPENNDLSHLSNEVEKGFNSKLTNQTYKEIFDEEVKKRIEDYKKGDLETVPFDQNLSTIREKLVSQI